MVSHNETVNMSIQQLSMPSVGFFATMRATVIKDLVIKKRYRADLVGDFIRSFMFIGVFSLFAGAFVFTSGTQLSEKETLLFFITGFTLIVFDGVALWTPLNSVATDLYNGTLEYLYSAPNSRMGYYVGNIISAGIFASIILVPTLGFLVIYGGVNLMGLFSALSAIAAMVLVLVAFGTMFALMAIMWKQVNSIAGILNTLFQFLSGFLIPISAFPQWIKYISYLLPYTWGIDLIRYYIMGSSWETQLPVALEWLILGVFVLIYWVLAMLLLRKVERYSKRKGLHLL